VNPSQALRFQGKPELSRSSEEVHTNAQLANSEERDSPDALKSRDKPLLEDQESSEDSREVSKTANS